MASGCLKLGIAVVVGVLVISGRPPMFGTCDRPQYSILLGFSKRPKYTADRSEHFEFKLSVALTRAGTLTFEATSQTCCVVAVFSLFDM